MEYKVCTICQNNLPIVEFNKNKTKADGLQSHCRSCNKDRSKKYYAANKEKHYQAASKRKQKIVKELRQFIYDYVVSHGCIDCGENNPACCDFDHVRGEKSGNISRMIHRGLSKNTILKEIDKCVIRCSNCHRKKTSVDFNWYYDLKKYYE